MQPADLDVLDQQIVRFDGRDGPGCEADDDKPSSPSESANRRVEYLAAKRIQNDIGAAALREVIDLGTSRRTARWRSLFLSTGELSLADKMQEMGKRARAGQEVRLVDVPADAGAGLGIFETLHDFDTPDAFARHLRDASARLYGTPIRTFLAQIAPRLVLDRAGLRKLIEENRREFVSDHVPLGASGQVSSVAGRFALLAAAGDLATAFGITGWPDGEARKAAATCFQAWLARRGSAGEREVTMGLAQVRAFFEQHASARFEAPWAPNPKDRDGNPIELRTVNRVGFKRRGETGVWEYLVLPKAFNDEVCKGHDRRLIVGILQDKGLLLPGSDGKATTSMHVPGHGQMRLYRIAAAILDDEDDRES